MWRCSVRTGRLWSERPVLNGAAEIGRGGGSNVAPWLLFALLVAAGGVLSRRRVAPLVGWLRSS